MEFEQTKYRLILCKINHKLAYAVAQWSINVVYTERVRKGSFGSRLNIYEPCIGRLP